MDTSANTITTMGIISSEVYNTTPGKDYFSDLPDNLVANGITYKVKDFADTSSDMQALLLETQKLVDGELVGTGEYVIAFRGTESIMDWVVNLSSAIYNYSPQFNDALAFVQKAIDSGIDKNKITLTGHSLGGILTQAVGATLSIEGYAFNPWGTSTLTTASPTDIKALFAQYLQRAMDGTGAVSADITFAQEHILNISYQDSGAINGDILSNFLTGLISEHLGAYLPIVGADVDLYYGHIMPTLNDAIAHYNDILTHFTTDTTYSDLSAAYLSMKDYDRTESLFNELGVLSAPENSLSFTFLTDNTATSIASLAKTDTATLYALVHLNPFAIQGNLEAYNNIKVDDYSDMYLKDRSQMLYYTIHLDEYDTAHTTYEDKTLGVALNNYASSNNKVIFGSESGEMITTIVDENDEGDGNDHLYGMGGNDVLDGRGGDDYLEGGEGDDRLFGDEGNDKLLGNNGNDYLDAGSGEDTLDGGEGSDTLMGGDDYDTYLAGNGDTISDSDGKGRVNFENNMLSGGTYNKNTGTYEGNGGSYTLSGGTLTFTNASGTITIENYSKSANSLGIHLEDKDDEDEENQDTNDILPETSTGEGHNENFSSPLVLDLNGNGTTSTFIAQSETYFDMDGDGFKERTSWTENSDGLLTLDLNNDGKVTNGTELFGNNTKLANGTTAKDGFEALSQYDLNKDNVIDSKDSIYSHLKVWIDSNSDGISTTDELKTLQELNITSINLNATETSTSEAYNQISDSSTFTQDGQSKTINDVWFYQNKSDTTYDYTTSIKESVAALPTIEGSGRVKDLRDAMNDDTVLEAKVTNLLKSASSMNFASFSTAFKDMVARWSGTDTISATATRGTQSVLNHNYSNASPIYVKEVYAYARDVAILEAFAGKSFSMVADGVTTSDVIGTEASVAMNEAYKELQYSQMIAFLSDAMYGESLSKDELISKLQTTLTTTPNDTLSTLLLSTMVYRYGLDTLESFDSSLLSDSSFQTALSTNGISYSINALGEVVGTYGNVQEGSSGNDTLSATSTGGYLYGGDGNDTLYGGSGKDVIDGGAGDDRIYGGYNNDVLRGGDGNDYIVAGISESDSYYGHDILEGGKGNDTLIGTGRNSTYVYNYGDGYDTITDSGNIGATTDVLSLRGIVLSDLNFRTSGNDVIIDILDVNDATVVNGSITIKNGVGSGAIETLQLEDATYNLNGLLNTQVINGERVYLIENNFGSLTLSSLNNVGLLFGEGISSEDIIVQASSNSNNLVIALKEEGKSFSELTNKLTLTNWFSDASRIDTFTFSDGTVLSANDVVNLQGTENADTVHLLDSTSDVTLSLGLGNDVAQMLGGNDSVDGGEGNDTLKGGAGNDVLKGGVGADALYGESGNDTLEGGSGNDTLQGGEGNDTYIFAKGDGKDTIIDTSGENALSFGTGITAEDLMFVKSGNDLIVALKDGNKSFEELSDSITLINWYSPSGSIKTLEFYDGTSYDEEAIYAQLLKGGLVIGTTSDDTIIGTDNADTIYAGAGNDVLNGGKGVDNLQGASGNDTYVFNRGDGSDTITDDYRYAPYYWNTNYTIQGNGGNDTLSFGEGITADDIIVQASANSNDLIVALKEEGKSFDELTDKIVLKDWFSTNNRIETLTFSDGTTLSTNDIVNLQGTEDDDTVHLVDSTSDVTLSMQSGDDIVQTSGGNDTIDGGLGDDTIKSGTGNDVLLGNEGDDTLYGEVGNDVLNGGKGVDNLQGGAGNDTYIFKRGDGSDTVYDDSRYTPYYWYPSYVIQQDGGNDTLSFGEGITTDDLIVKASDNSNDLIVALKEDGKSFDELSDKIVLKDWFSTNNRIETFTFNDGTTLHVNDIVNLQGTENDDTVHLVDSTSDVTLSMQGGDDVVQTAGGNDTIDGGAGNDTLKGGAGNDTYLYSKNGGTDTIIDTSGNDTLSFGEGITTDDIIVKASVNSNDLIVALKEEGKSFDELSNKIILKDWFSANNRIESFTFSDGTILHVNDIVNLQGTEDDDTVHLVDSTSDVTLSMQGGDDVVQTSGGNDTIDGGEGDDNLQGSLGNDTYIFRRGSGSDVVYDDYRYTTGTSWWNQTVVQEDAGLDTLSFGEGITADDLIIKVSSDSNDLTVALKEDGKSFDELTDRIILKDWFNVNNRIETFTFSDGTTLSTNDIVNLQGTEGSDTVHLMDSTSDVTLSMQGGDDVVQTSGGNDTIDGRGW